MKETQSYVERYDAIQKAINRSELFREATESFKKGLKDYSFTPQEQANAYASFLAQTVIGLQAQSMETALRLEITQIQSDQLRSQGVLQTESLKLKVAKEQEEIAQSREQTKIAAATAEQETIKCEVLVKSANDNTEINKIRCMTEYMSVLGTAARPELLTNEMQDYVYQSAQNIGKKLIKKAQKPKEKDVWKSTEIAWTRDALNYFKVFGCFGKVYATKLNPQVGEEITVGVISNEPLKHVGWYEDEKVLEGKTSEEFVIAFDQPGYRTIKVLAKPEKCDLWIEAKICLKVHE